MCHGLLEYHGLKVLLHVLKNELETIKRFASWNNFPKYVTSNIMKKAINKTTSNDGSNQSNSNPVVTIWFHLPYCGYKSF